MGEPLANNEKSVQLTCKHLFHDQCIRGWTLVGKKDTCPVCLEKVDLRTLYADRPWDTRNLTWYVPKLLASCALRKQFSILICHVMCLKAAGLKTADLQALCFRSMLAYRMPHDVSRSRLVGGCTSAIMLSAGRFLSGPSICVMVVSLLTGSCSSLN